MKSGPSEVLTQRPIIQHGLVDHKVKLTNTKALLTMEKYSLFTFLAGQTKGLGKSALDSCLQCLLFGVSQACLPEYEFLE